MRFWPFKREKRDSGGDFTDAVVRLIEAQAAGTAADASSTAAVEAAAGALSRAFAGAVVDGSSRVLDAVTPAYMAQVGRDLIRSGDSMHVIRIIGGRMRLIPAASWHFEGGENPEGWTVRVTTYGPSTSTTRHLPYSGVVFVRWGGTPGQPYVGTGPLAWAHTTARLQSETERSLADEAAGPLAQILPLPVEGSPGEDEDPLKALRADIAAARGRVLTPETTAAGYGEGKSAAPARDFDARRLGPNPPESMATIREDAFKAVLAACGTPPDLFSPADGTAQREALRRWHSGTVLPLARLLEFELTAKFETEVRIRFDGYPLDLAGRASAFQKLVAGGVDVTAALAQTGLLVEDAA